MALLIDGYNLLHVTNIFGEGNAGTALRRARQGLLDFLAASLNEKQRRETTIVFDAAGAPPGLPRSLLHDGISILFARNPSDADAMIEDFLESHAAPRSLVVVSSDHRVQRAARHRGASFVDSELWYRELLAARRETSAAAADVPSKPAGELTSDQVAYWLDKFSEPLADEPSATLRWNPAAEARLRDADEPSGNDPIAPTEADQENVAEDKPITDDLANPFPPGYAEDLLDEESER